MTPNDMQVAFQKAGNENKGQQKTFERSTKTFQFSKINEQYCHTSYLHFSQWMIIFLY